MSRLLAAAVASLAGIAALVPATAAAPASPPTAKLVVRTAGGGNDQYRAGGHVKVRETPIECERRGGEGTGPGADNVGVCEAEIIAGKGYDLRAIGDAKGGRSRVRIEFGPGGTGCNSLSEPGEEGKCVVGGPAGATVEVRVTFVRDYGYIWLRVKRGGPNPEGADGTVRSDPTGLTCGINAGSSGQNQCGWERFEAGTRVRLTVTANAGTTFVWDGCDSTESGGSVCIARALPDQGRWIDVTLIHQDVEVTGRAGPGTTGGPADTERLPGTLAVETAGGGNDPASAQGVVFGDGIDCSRRSAADNQGTCTVGGLRGGATVRIGARPVGDLPGRVRLSGPGCDIEGELGRPVECSITAQPAKRVSVRATFIRNVYTLRIPMSGAGRVRSAPAGIDCRSTSGKSAPYACTARFAEGSVITLVATADNSQALTSLTGCREDDTGSGHADCKLVIAGDTTVNANFGPSVRP